MLWIRVRSPCLSRTTLLRLKRGERLYQPLRFLWWTNQSSPCAQRWQGSYPRFRLCCLSPSCSLMADLNRRFLMSWPLGREKESLRLIESLAIGTGCILWVLVLVLSMSYFLMPSLSGWLDFLSWGVRRFDLRQLLGTLWLPLWVSGVVLILHSVIDLYFLSNIKLKLSGTLSESANPPTVAESLFRLSVEIPKSAPLTMMVEVEFTMTKFISEGTTMTGKSMVLVTPWWVTSAVIVVFWGSPVTAKAQRIPRFNSCESSLIQNTARLAFWSRIDTPVLILSSPIRLKISHLR